METKLFNVCIDEAIYPDIFKCLKISPVFNKGIRTHIEPGRQISVLYLIPLYISVPFWC